MCASDVLLIISSTLTFRSLYSIKAYLPIAKDQVDTLSLQKERVENIFE